MQHVWAWSQLVHMGYVYSSGQQAGTQWGINGKHWLLTVITICYYKYNNIWAVSFEPHRGTQWKAQEIQVIEVTCDLDLEG